MENSLVFDLRADAVVQTGHRQKVLLVDDDESLVELLRALLEEQGFGVFGAMDGNQALETLTSEHLELVILDLGIPGKDGVEVLARIRSVSDIPVIILSGRHEIEVKVRCLDLGADDYITKPFESSELLARCRLALRHAGAIPISSSLVCEIQLNIRKRQLLVRGSEVNLTRLEFKLLRGLVVNGGTLLDYVSIQDSVWGHGGEVDKDVIHHLASRLRYKIEADPLNPRHIIAVPGVGYVFKE